MPSTRRPFRPVLSNGLLLAFAATAIALIGAGVVGASNLRTVYLTSQAVSRTFEVKGALRDILTAAIDAETGQRGFIITGKESYLEPYDRGRSAMVAELRHAQSLITDSPDQQADLDRLSAAAQLKLDELAEAVRARRDGGLAAAQAVVETDVGKRTMDQMRAIAGTMNAREDARLASRRTAAAAGYRTAVITGVGTAGLALVTVGALFLVTRRFGVERRKTEETAERLDVTLGSIGDGVVVTDEQGRVVRLNPVAEALTGWTNQDAAGKRLEEVFVIVNEDTRLPVENPIGKVLRENVIVGLANHTILIARDGHEVPIDDSAAPIRTTEGVVAGVVLVFRDVAGRREAEKERAALLELERAARTEVERANRSKDEFFAVLSHELRTPLSAVLGYAQMLRAGLLPPDRTAHALEAIERNAAAQTRLIESLLDLSRVVADKLDLSLDRISLASVLEAAVDVIRPSADAKQIAVDVALGPDAMVLGDAGRLQQVFWNLLSNAVKFTGRGGRIHVRLTRVSETCRVQVTDTGTGISREFLPHIFDRFAQATPGNGPAPGLGIGLTIAREIVQAHHGTIAAESAGSGAGSTFTVTLPVMADTTTAISPGGVTAAPAPQSQVSVADVLVVDDEPDARNMLALLLTSRGAAVRTAASAQEALAHIEQAPPDVLLSDLAMPGEDGLSLIRAVRARELESRRKRIHAIAVTAQASPADRSRAVEAGFDAHVAKPVEIHELIRLVTEVSGRSRS